jgi:hypothetical protein
MYDAEPTSFDDGPQESRRALRCVLDECMKEAASLAEMVGSVERRVAPLRLAVPRPPTDERAMKVAREIHSPMVDQLYNLRDNMQSAARRLSALLDELEV